MRAVQICAAVVMVSSLSGCVVPMPVTVAAKGRVVDAAANRPVEGAIVRVKDAPAARTATSKDGSFSLAARHRWIVVLAPTCRNGPVRSILVIEKPGYRMVELPIIDGDEEPLHIALRATKP
jgi:hypothetical protein